MRHTDDLKRRPPPQLYVPPLAPRSAELRDARPVNVLVFAYGPYRAPAPGRALDPPYNINYIPAKPPTPAPWPCGREVRQYVQGAGPPGPAACALDRDSVDTQEAEPGRRDGGSSRNFVYVPLHTDSVPRLAWTVRHAVGGRATTNVYTTLSMTTTGFHGRSIYLGRMMPISSLSRG